MKYLVTSIGSASAEVVIKNLKSSGNIVYGSDINEKSLISTSRIVNMFFKVNSILEHEIFLTQIIDICIKYHVNYIVPLTDLDVDFFSKYKNIFVDKEIKIWLAKEDAISILRNKFYFSEYIKNNFSDLYIKTKFLNDLNSVDSRKMLKPISGRSSQNVHMIENDSDLLYYKSKYDNNSYIVQDFIDGNIITVDLIRNPSDNFIVSIARKELIRSANGLGISVEILSHSSINDYAAKIATDLNIVGTVNFEFIFNEFDKTVKILEINPRFSGGVAFSCIAGYNFIRNTERVYMNKKIQKKYNLRLLRISRRYKEYIMESGDLNE